MPLHLPQEAPRHHSPAWGCTGTEQGARGWARVGASPCPRPPELWAAPAPPRNREVALRLGTSTATWNRCSFKASSHLRSRHPRGPQEPEGAGPAQPQWACGTAPVPGRAGRQGAGPGPQHSPAPPVPVLSVPDPPSPHPDEGERPPPGMWSGSSSPIPPHGPGLQPLNTGVPGGHCFLGWGPHPAHPALPGCILGSQWPRWHYGRSQKPDLGPSGKSRSEESGRQRGWRRACLLGLVQWTGPCPGPAPRPGLAPARPPPSRHGEGRAG